jgi:hypothetical protein
MRITPQWNKSTREHSIFCEMVGGADISAKVYGDVTDELTTPPIIPAQPGYTLLAFYLFDDGKEGVERSPVIAWKIDIDLNEFHEGIGLIHPSDNVLKTGILCPDGRVIEIGDSFYDNEEQWLEYARKGAAERAAKKKKLKTDPEAA